MNRRAVEVERRMEIPLALAAVLTLPALLLEDSSRHGSAHVVGYLAGVLLWLLFLGYTLAMLAVVDSRREWLRRHPLDVAIVLFTPPFLFTAIQGLRVLRVLRVLRIFRLAPTAKRMFTSDGLQYVSLLALLVLLVSAEAFSSAENISYGNALYWAITTMTTVGYGDISPHTDIGKIVASVVMVVGIGFFAILTGAVAQQFLAEEVTELEQDERDLVDQIREISDQLKRLEQRALQQARRSRI